MSWLETAIGKPTWGVEIAPGQGRKRKLSDDATPPSKIPQLETNYKLGPRNAQPGKIKCIAVSAVHHPVKEANVLKAGSRQPSTFDFTRSSDSIKLKP